MSEEEIELFKKMKDAFLQWDSMDEEFFFDNPGYMVDEVESFAKQVKAIDDK